MMLQKHGAILVIKKIMDITHRRHAHIVLVFVYSLKTFSWFPTGTKVPLCANPHICSTK